MAKKDKKKKKKDAEQSAEPKKLKRVGAEADAEVPKKKKKREEVDTSVSKKKPRNPELAEAPAPRKSHFVPLPKDAMDIKWIPVEDIHPNPLNPNEMSNDQFNLLVERIKNTGFRRPIGVFLLDESDPRVLHARENGNKRPQYELEAGEHRWEAIRQLGYKEAPCIVDAVNTDSDARIALLVSDNVIGGEMSAEKFTKLVEKGAFISKYGSDITADMMGFTDKEAMQEYLLEVEESMPTPEMKEEFQKQKKNMKSIEDVTRIVNGIFAKFGGTVELNYMFLEFGGQTHLTIWMDRATRAIADEISSFCVENKLDINKVLQVVFTKGWDETVPELVKAENKKSKVTDEDDEDDDDVFDDEDTDYDDEDDEE